jgi:hypothetical protein
MISALQKDNFFMGEESNNYSGEPSFGGSSYVGLFLSTHPYHLIKFNCSRRTRTRIHLFIVILFINKIYLLHTKQDTYMHLMTVTISYMDVSERLFLTPN